MRCAPCASASAKASPWSSSGSDVIQLGDIAVHAEVSGPASGVPVLLLHSLGTNLHMWDPQAAALAKHHRVIRIDMRGHGLTEAPAGPYTMEMLARDALALLQALGIARAHVGGVSIGGHIAMRMAALAPDRVLSLMPCDTALDFGGPANWQERMDIVAAKGMAAVADATIGRSVLDQSLASSKGLRRMLLGTDPVGWLGCAAALRDTTGAELPGRVKCPTTVIVGDRDESTRPPRRRRSMRRSPTAAWWSSPRPRISPISSARRRSPAPSSRI